MKIILLLAALVVVVMADDSEFDVSKDDDTEWAMFKALYNVHYGSREEEQMRKAVFLKTLAMVRDIHNNYLIGKSSWDASINGLADRVNSCDNKLMVISELELYERRSA